ncbi:hypothetical protein PR202_gb26704 [Eleusine coracana subsp. coracana]|uniref:Uncharacterized protein n=1 Tax=Eleusine coracana subsp. coracana TaxID=191504 RepID=A0AAV5FSV2_ELECO|nr:hypothetical protein PR202_gb26704 [Eleusine coracana subsp. coracana]
MTNSSHALVGRRRTGANVRWNTTERDWNYSPVRVRVVATPFSRCGTANLRPNEPLNMSSVGLLPVNISSSNMPRL